MIRLSIVAILMVVLTGCLLKGNKKPFGEDLSQLTPDLTIDELTEHASQVADSLLLSIGSDLQLYERKVVVYPTYLEIEYYFKDSRMLGGGSIVKISRTTLQVIGEVHYQ